MTYTVVQWATGNVGRAAIDAVRRHPELELVGCWVHSDAKNGQDAGELAGLEPCGVTATTSIDDILVLDADCVIYAPMMPNPREVKKILSSGKSVVTPVGWIYAKARPDYDELHQLCVDHKVVLHGTGIHPGGITERFPLMISALSSSITHVVSEEFSDIRSYDTEWVVREMMMFGKKPGEMANNPMGKLLADGYGQSIDMIADELQLTLDPEHKIVHTWSLATENIDTPIGVIEKGTVAAQRFEWQGCVDGEPRIVAIVNWLMGEEKLEPGWQIGEKGERFEVSVTGDPSTTVTFKGLQPETVNEGIERNAGVVATANHLVNSIPYVCTAEPGVRSYLDLPLIAGRAQT